MYLAELSTMVMEFDTAQGGQTTPTPTGVAVLSACAGILIALIGVWSEMHKTRRAQQKVEHEVAPPPQHGSRDDSAESLREEVQRIGNMLNQLDNKMDDHSDRLARVETRLEIPSRRTSKR